MFFWSCYEEIAKENAHAWTRKLELNQQLFFTITVKIFRRTYRQVLHKSSERSTFDFNRLPRAIVKRQHEVKKVALTKIRWRLLLKMCSGQTATTGRRIKVRKKLPWDFTTNWENFLTTLVRAVFENMKSRGGIHATLCGRKSLRSIKVLNLATWLLSMVGIQPTLSSFSGEVTLCSCMNISKTNWKLQNFFLALPSRGR